MHLEKMFPPSIFRISIILEPSQPKGPIELL
jgi:hypothetical protein